VLEVKEIVEKELGFVPSKGSEHCDDYSSMEDKTAFLYVSKKRIIGFCTVELILQAFRLQSNEKKCVNDGKNGSYICQRSQKPSPATMGVYQIWCHGAHRRKGIAKKLLDTARSKLVYGTTIDIGKVAFSSPTGEGQAFAQKYTGNAEPLIYDC
jgi:N-acetyltransferase